MRRSFGGWLIVIFALSIFAPLLLFSLAVSTYYNQMFLWETEQNFSNTLFSVSQNITTYIEDLNRLSMMPFFHEDIMSNLNQINEGKYTTDPIVTVNINKQYQMTLTQQLSTSRKDVDSILFVPFNDQIDQSFLVRRYSGTLEVLKDFNAKSTDWYKGALDADGMIYFSQDRTRNYGELPNTYYFSTNASTNFFSIARLIKDTSTLRPIGVLKVDAADDIIRDVFTYTSTSPSSALMLLDQNGQVIYGTKDIDDQVLKSITPDTKYLSTGKDEYYVFVANVKSTPWQLCYLVSKADIRAKTVTIYYAAALLGLICLAVAVIFFYINSRKTVHGMNQILMAMTQIASGDLNVRLHIDSRNYLSIIGEALNKTAIRLEEHINREYKAVLNQKDAEYLALQAQINPHFLNNILSTLITLNRVGERDTIEKSILQLSDLFRYTSKKDNTNRVQDEFDFLFEYLSLQKLRFSERLHFQLTCTPKASQVVIPKLLVQPLVENSIIHGMEPYDKEIHIYVLSEVVTISGWGSHLLIVVQDDGAGFDPRQIPPNRIGLTNIQERLELFCPDSVFQIISSPGKGCQCVMYIPIKEVET